MNEIEFKDADQANKPEEKTIEEMNKDELEAYAREKFGKELDKRKNLDNLLKEVKKLEDGAGEQERGKKEKQEAVARYLKHPENGTVWESTELLRARGDMIPCDENGNPV